MTNCTLAMEYIYIIYLILYSMRIDILTPMTKSWLAAGQIPRYSHSEGKSKDLIHRPLRVTALILIRDSPKIHSIR